MASEQPPAATRHTVNGATMALAEAGRRRPLLLIHGFPMDHALWRPQLRAFAPQRRVLAPDLVGFGQSTPAGRESLDAHADDLAALLDRLEIRQVVVVGLSMGGYIAFAMWRRHRARIAALVLVASRARADRESERAGRYQSVVSVEQDGVGVLADPLVPRLLGPEATDAVRQDVRDMTHRQPPSGVIGALKAMAARPDSTSDLPTIDVPTLVVVGAEDGITPVDDSRHIAERVPGARLVVVPRAGHLPPLEEPGAFNAALRTFLQGVDAEADG